MAKTNSTGRSPAAAAQPDTVQAIVEVDRGQTVVAQGVKSEAFVLHARRADVANFAREGSSLIVELKDGSKLRIDNFFVRNNQLLLIDGEQPYQVDFRNALGKAGGDGIADQLVQFQPVAINIPGANISTQALLAILGVGAGAAIIANHRGGSASRDSGSSEQTPAAPAAPTSYVDKAGTIKNTHSTAPTTDDTQPGINIPALQTGQTASLYVDGKKVISRYVDSASDPQAATLVPVASLGEGKHEFTYTVTGADGKESASSQPLTITIVTTPPATPAAPASYVDDAGLVTHDHSTAPTTADATPGIRIGAVAAGQKPALYVDGQKVDAEYDAQAGTLTPRSPLPDGKHAFTYTLTDAAGNESHLSGPLILIIDTVPATTASISIDTPIAGDNVINAQEAAAGVRISGHTTGVEDGQHVSVYVTDSSKVGFPPWTTQVSGGVWSVNLPGSFVSRLFDGDLTVTASVADKAGHTANSTQHASLDTTPPVAPTLMATDHVGTATGPVSAGSTTDDAQPTLSGSGEAGATITIYDGTTVLGSATVQPSGQWSLTLATALAEGAHSLTAKATDPAGNTGAASAALNFTVDTGATPTVLPSASISAIAADDGSAGVDSASGYVVGTGALTISGSLSTALGSGQHVQIDLGDGRGWQDVGASAGSTTWSFDTGANALKEGDYTIQVRVADGSASSTPDTQFLRVDLSPPSQTLLDDITVSSDGLTLSGVMSGWMGHIDTLAISVDGAPARSVDIHSDNDTWSYTLPAGQELAAGSHHTANLTLTDFAGNTSYLPSQPLDVTTVVRSLSTDAMADDDMANAQEAANLSINRNAIDAEDGQSGTIKISADSVGHGVEQVDGFTLGVYGETPHTSRIDLSQLLTGYTPTAADGPAHDVAGQATIDAGDSIGDYLKVKTENGNTVISVDRDGAAMAFSEVPVVMLNGVSTDLATLLANHQIVVSHG